MSDIWEIGAKTGAADMYDSVKSKVFFSGKVFAVRFLANMCDEMSEEYEGIIEDENEYLISVEENLDEVEDLQKSLEEQSAELEARKAELLQKEEDGTITDEERAELEQFDVQIEELTQSTNAQIDESNDSVGENPVQKTVSQKDIASDYGNTAVEKGEPLAQTEVKGGFFRKLLGTTGKAEKEAGEKAVTAGNNLLERIGESTEIETEIEAKTDNAEQ